MFMDNTSFTTK